MCRDGGVPEGRGSPPPDAASHFLELFRDDRCIATDFVGFFIHPKLVLSQAVVVVRVDKFMDKFSGLLADGIVGGGGNIGGEWKIRSLV